MDSALAVSSRSCEIHNVRSRSNLGPPKPYRPELRCSCAWTFRARSSRSARGIGRQVSKAAVSQDCLRRRTTCRAVKRGLACSVCFWLQFAQRDKDTYLTRPGSPSARGCVRSSEMSQSSSAFEIVAKSAALASGALHNVVVKRLLNQEEVVQIRHTASTRSTYKPPGK
jgi:hypothetical protein